MREPVTAVQAHITQVVDEYKSAYLHSQMKYLAELVNERNELWVGEAQRDELRHSREGVVS